MKKRVFSILKYAVALCLLGWVLSRAELSRMAEHVTSLPPLAIITAMIAFNLSQWFSALRLRYYYENAGMRMSQGTALALNYAGMFYNLLLPGGIGGDAYKVYLMKRMASFPVMPGIRVQFANRGNGLLAMLMLMFGMLSSLDVGIRKEWLVLLATLLSAISVYGYRFIAAKFLKENAEITWAAFRYSLGVQIMALVAVVALVLGMHAQAGMVEYLLLFLTAAILGLLPMTVGGLGVREATFFYGAHFFNHYSTTPVVDAELGVTLSLLYFGVTALSSLPGILCGRWLSQNLGQNPAGETLMPSPMTQAEATP